jgi:hypothetical protein
LAHRQLDVPGCDLMTCRYSISEGYD